MNLTSPYMSGGKCHQTTALTLYIFKATGMQKQFAIIWLNIAALWTSSVVSHPQANPG